MRAFTLVELIVVFIILGVLAAIGLPAYRHSRENTLNKEAIVNLKLLAAAEKIYRKESRGYYPFSGTETAMANIYANLKLSPGEANWDYSIAGSGNGSSFTAYADRLSGSGCQYSINNTQDEPLPNANCP